MQSNIKPSFNAQYRYQQGSISILGGFAIVAFLSSLLLVFEAGDKVMMDRNLDNYAQSLAPVALRAELAITKGMLDQGVVGMNHTKETLQSILSGANIHNNADISVSFVYGNIVNNAFVPLVANAEHPNSTPGLASQPAFAAVALKLTAPSAFGLTPEGKAIYGMTQTQAQSAVDDNGCYCKDRYTTCVDMDLTATDLAALPSVEATKVAVKGSTERKNYCRFGFSRTKSGTTTETKYPFIDLGDTWIGRPPEQPTSFFSFYSQSYSGEAFDRVLKQMPVAVTDGADPFKSTSSWSMFSMFCFFGCSSSPDIIAKEQNLNVFDKVDITPSSIVSDYRCYTPGMFGFGAGVIACSSASSTNDVVLSDSVYVGYQGTCISNTDASNVSMSRCLSNTPSTPVYQSCLEIEKKSSLSMNFFQRMIAFFFGPLLNWQASYEGLDCEMKNMQWFGWGIWGGWSTI